MMNPSPLASPLSRSPLQNPKYPFSPEHSLDLEKMSLTGTENISQADESIGGASLLNVFNDGPLSPLKPLNHTGMSIGDSSIPVPSIGLSNIGDQDSMMGISVMLDSSVKGMAQHVDGHGSVMGGASAMSVDSGRMSRSSGSRSSSTDNRSASGNRPSSPASFHKTGQVDKQYNPGEAGPNQGQLLCKE